MVKINFVGLRDVLHETGQEIMQQQSLYNQAEFCNLIKPDSFRYARLEDSAGPIFIPFTGGRLLWKKRLFMLPYCQRFTPFRTKQSVLSEIPNDWFLWLREHTASSHWSFFVEGMPEHAGISKKTNQFLPLQTGFEELISKWKKGRRSALLKSSHLEVGELSHTHFRDCLLQLSAAKAGRGWRPTEKEIQAILNISASADFGSSISRYGVMDDKNCLSLVLFLRWNKRYHYLFSQSSDAGFQSDSLTRFFYIWIKLRAGEDAILDFEGSNLPGVQAYFDSLGAEEEKYFSFHKPLSFW